MPAEHYHFVKWYDGNTDNPRVISNITEDKALIAIFKIDQFTVSANANLHGKVEPRTQNVDYGSNSAAITATGDEGYHFVKWDDGNTDNPRIISNVTEDKVITASFEINKYTITFETDGTKGVSLEGDLSQVVEYGGKCSAVKAIGNDKVTLKNWTGTNGFETSERNPLIVTNVTSDMVITANFTPNKVTEGNVVTITPEKIPDWDELFTKTPKLYAELTPRGKSKIKRFSLRKLMKINKKAPSEFFQAIWKKVIPLFDKKALRKAHKSGMPTSLWLQYNPIKNLPFNLKIKTKDSNGQKIDKDLNVGSLTPPIITEILNANGKPLSSSINKGDIITIKGLYFGKKKPRVSLEYLDNSGKVKYLRIRILKPLEYANFKGKAGKSCMNLFTGESTIKVQVLKDSKPLPNDSNGIFDLIINNKFGIAIEQSTGKVPTLKIVE